MNRLLITFGGTDPSRETLKVLRAISKDSTLFSEVVVVIGAGNSDRNEIEKLATHLPNVQTLFNTTQMPELLASADFAIMAGGTTTWERCCLGVPAIVISAAENQKELALALSAGSFQVYLGPSDPDLLIHFSENKDIFKVSRQSRLDSVAVS